MVLIVSLVSFCLRAQSPTELLQLAQSTYDSPASYEISGHVSVEPAESSWRITIPVKLASSGSSQSAGRRFDGPAVLVGGAPQFEKVGTGSDEKPLSFTTPFAVTGFWMRIAKNVELVEDAGLEKLPLNGSLVSCRVLKVTYREGGGELSPATYSICGEKHLVLKKVVSCNTGKHLTDPAVPWTVTFDTARW